MDRALALFAALSTVFLFGEHRNYFYWDYDRVPSQNMAIVANLSADHGFAEFLHRTCDSAGAVAYGPYNRFPIGGYAALKLAMLPFEGDLSAQIFAAKTLAVCIFCAAAVAAWLALSRILCDRWDDAAATFGISCFDMGRYADPVRHAETPRGFEATGALGHDAASVRTLWALPGDFDAIREEMPEGSSVWIPTPYDRADLRVETYGARCAVDFYLSGYVLTRRDAADFVLTNERVDGPALLTPENREVFLYDGALYDGWRRDKP